MPIEWCFLNIQIQKDHVQIQRLSCGDWEVCKPYTSNQLAGMFHRTSLRQLNWEYINHIANTKYYFSWSQIHLKAQALKRKRELGEKGWSIWQLAIYIKFPWYYGWIIFYLHRLHSTVMTLVLVRVMQTSHKGSIDLLFCNSIWITRENLFWKDTAGAFYFFQLPIKWACSQENGTQKP